MKLGKKNLIYSIFLAAAILAIIVSYLAVLLPNLYVKQNIESITEEIKKSHFNMVKDGNNLHRIGKLGNQIFMEVDKNFDKISINSIGLKGELNLKGSEVQKNLKNIETISKDLGQEKGKVSDNVKELNEQVNDMGRYFKDNFKINGIDTSLDFGKMWGNDDENTYSNFNRLKDDTVMISLGYRDGNVAEYINYILVTDAKNSYKVSLDSFIAPRIEDVLPVVLSSIPMIILVLMVLVIVVSSLYSKGIVGPIVQIQRFTEVSKTSKPDYKMIDFKGDDEISSLSKNIVEMDKSLRKNIEELRLESERKEVFTRSATHELKTPLAASVLLCDGMINNLGKYADRDKYLKVLKKELLEMNTMVSDILLTTKNTKELSYSQVNVREIFMDQIGKLKFKADEKKLTFNLNGDGIVRTDLEVFSKVVDNILQNAVNYTKESGFINIDLSDDKMTVYNEVASIPREIENSIMEPFVSSTEKKSKGLGLYISKYYCNLLGLDISVKNQGKGVLTTLRRIK